MTHPHTSTRIRNAEPADSSAVAELLAEAFLHGDLAAWLIPHLGTRDRIYRPYFALHTEHALTYGHVDLAGDGHAVAIWYDLNEEPLPELPGYDQRLADITGPHVDRFRALDHAMSRHHPHRRPHHYLAFLAVHPDRQRHGHGSALLAHHHAQLDATGVPAYLEATGTRNRRLYVRHGYRPRPAYRITGDGPRLYPMWRPPMPADGNTGGPTLQSGSGHRATTPGEDPRG